MLREIIKRLKNVIFLIRMIDKLSKGNRTKLTLKRGNLYLELIEGLRIDIQFDSNNLDNSVFSTNMPSYFKESCDISYYLSDHNYRLYHQKLIVNYKKNFKLGENINSLLKNVPLDQRISFRFNDINYILVIEIAPPKLSGLGVSSYIGIKKKDLMDIFCYRGDISEFGGEFELILEAKEINFEVGKPLINQFYTDFLKLKKRTYKGGIFLISKTYI